MSAREAPFASRFLFLDFKGWASVFAELEPRLTWLRGRGCATAYPLRSWFDSRPEAHA